MSKILESVLENPLFASLTRAEQEAVLSAGIPRKYPKGAMLVMAGEVWPFLFLIVEGKISAFKESTEGRSLLVATLEAGDIFWGLAFFHTHAGMPVRLEAANPSHIYLWEHSRLLPILLNNGRASWELCRSMAARMLRTSDMVEGLAFQPVAGRVARFLLDQTPPEGIPAPRLFTLDQMAAHMGTTREMVCRCLQRFSEEGLIYISRTEYTVTDRERLKKMSEQVKG